MSSRGARKNVTRGGFAAETAMPPRVSGFYGGFRYWADLAAGSCLPIIHSNSGAAT